MNSGLPITQRVNHGLWVHYYDDPVNGNPGTDATIFDPNPDIRFLNDTGHYILIDAYMNMNTGDLEIAFWGTSDGRKGYFTHPVLHDVYPYGEQRNIETTDLAPGVVECQIPHKGASTSFTYTRELANGERIDRVFKSYYRPVPRICATGVSEETEEGEESEGDKENSGEVVDEDENGEEIVADDSNTELPVQNPLGEEVVE